MKEEMKQLLEWSQTFGVLKFNSHRDISNFNLAFQPFYSTQQFYQRLGKYQLIWHKVFLNISKDPTFIKKLFQPLIDRDLFVKRLFKIYKKSLVNPKKDGIAFSRGDYYNDLQGNPKMTEYNLFSIGMQSNQQKFQDAKKMLDKKESHLYPETATVRSFAKTLSTYLAKKEAKGILLFVCLQKDNNMFDQKRLELEMIRENIKVKRVTIQQMYKYVTKNEKGDLFFKNQLVSVVYFRAGYRDQHFMINGDSEAGWQLKEDIELSNASVIPPIAMELINQKRVQIQMTKPDILRKYCSDEQAKQIQKTFVKCWQFDNMSEQEYLQLIERVKAHPEGYILKPNLEGGSNNFYGVDCLKKLQSMTRQEARIYIVMEKIFSKGIPNSIIDGEGYVESEYLIEISRCGAFSWINQELLTNEVSGFLLRAKPVHANEGGIMTGIGSIVTWKFTEK